MLDGPSMTTRLTTRRLLLRPFTMRDAPAVQELCADEEVARYLLRVPHPYPDGAAEQWIQFHPQFWETGMEFPFAITLAANGALVGAIGLVPNVEHSRGELGYWIGRPFWGKGYATEAVRAVTDWAFDTLDCERVHAHHDVANAASGRVLEKAGLTREGTLRGHFERDGVRVDAHVWGVLRSEWPR